MKVLSKLPAKLKSNYVYIFLILIIASSFAFQSYMLFSKPLHEDAYLTLRYTEHIKTKFTPIFYDNLSYGGRAVEEPFIFYYILALFSQIHAVFIKIIPALLAALLALIVFLIASEFVEQKLALLPALFAAFIPALFKINIISPIILGFILLFSLIYSFNKIEDTKFLYFFVILSILLPLTTSLSIFFIFSLLIYFMIVGIERKKLSKLEKEALLFSLFVNLLLILLIFRNSFLNYGLSFIWQNIPDSILANYFKGFSLINTLNDVGAAALFFGAIGFIFSFREKKSLFLSSFLISSLIFLWFKLLPLNHGLIIFSITLAALSALSIKFLFSYLRETKFSDYDKYIIIIIFILIILTSALPAALNIIKSESKVDSETLKALKAVEVEGEVIVAPYEYGHAITFTGNKDVADSNFLLADSPERRLDDIKTVYTSVSEPLVLEILRKYSAKFIVFDEFVKESYGVEELTYIKNKECFRRVYGENETKIYRNRC